MKLLIIALITFPIISTAQRNHPGIRYFDGGILKGGDSIQGSVGYLPRKKVVVFKTPSGVQYLSSAKIEGFFFSNGASFMSGTESNKSDTSSHFLQQLVIGDSASLFYDLVSKTYLLKKGEKITIVDSKKSGRKLNSNLELIESKEYILALLQEMANCKAITPVIYKTKVNQKELSSLTSLYNECLRAQYNIIPRIKPKKNIHLGLRISYEMSRFKIQSVYLENTYASKTFLTSSSPSIGLYYYREIGKTFRKAAFLTEINIIQENFKAYNEIPLSNDSVEFNTLNLKSLNIRMPFQFRIPLLSLNRKVNISSLFELMPIFRLNPQFSRVREVGHNDIFYTSLEEPFTLNHFDIAQSVGLGFEFPNNRNRNVFFDIQVGRKSIPITPANDSGAKNKNSYISFGLRLSI